MIYFEEKEFLDKYEQDKNGINKKDILNETEIEVLKDKYPSLPKDYLDYLLEIGAGTIREMQFKVQPYLFDFVDLGLEDIYQVKSDIMFFGDNFNGDFAGFDLSKRDGLVVEFLHESGELNSTNKTFKQFIREQMLIDENGNDLRIL